MARPKSKKKTFLGRLISTISNLSRAALGPGRWALLSMLAIAFLATATFVTWQKVADRVLSSDNYIVSAEDLDISRPPPWIHSDIATQVFERIEADAGRISIMDVDAVQRVAQASSSHPWVKRVLKVSKHHPARIRIELEYRKPACMVMVKTPDGSGGLYPVDEEGVFLPTADFSSVEASRYPWLAGFRAVAPTGGAGNHWGDERVVGGAEIAAAIGEEWQKLNLQRIEPAESGRSAYHNIYEYVLFTRQGTKIIWGRPPGNELPSEAPAADKIAWLKEFANVRGSLDLSPPRLPIDVRDRGGLKILDRMVMEKIQQDKHGQNKANNVEKSPMKETAAKHGPGRG